MRVNYVRAARKVRHDENTTFQASVLLAKNLVHRQLPAKAHIESAKHPLGVLSAPTSDKKRSTCMSTFTHSYEISHPVMRRQWDEKHSVISH